MNKQKQVPMGIDEHMNMSELMDICIKMSDEDMQLYELIYRLNQI